MKIKITRTISFAHDGYTTTYYMGGQVVDNLHAPYAEQLITCGAAVVVAGEKALDVSQVENKALPEAPENKGVFKKGKK